MFEPRPHAKCFTGLKHTAPAPICITLCVLKTSAPLRHTDFPAGRSVVDWMIKAMAECSLAQSGSVSCGDHFIIIMQTANESATVEVLRRHYMFWKHVEYGIGRKCDATSSMVPS